MSLPPPPTHLARQSGMSSGGSPINLSRSTSTTSQLSVDDSLRSHLESYLLFLQHEIEFIGNEIQALSERMLGTDPVQESSFQTLRDGLKVRFNRLQIKKERITGLLDVL